MTMCVLRFQPLRVKAQESILRKVSGEKTRTTLQFRKFVFQVPEIECLRSHCVGSTVHERGRSRG